jgi:prepilin-type N-terminal cleavage/methylation domain-containing protein
MHAIRSTARAGMTLIEVLFAIVILSGVMLSLSRFGQAFTRATSNAANLAIASDLAAARIEAVKGHATYATLVSVFDADIETSTDASANPSMAGAAGYVRSTRAVRTVNDTTDFVTVTVTVNASVLTAPVAKTVLIAAFP